MGGGATLASVTRDATAPRAPRFARRRLRRARQPGARHVVAASVHVPGGGAERLLRRRGARAHLRLSGGAALQLPTGRRLRNLALPRLAVSGDASAAVASVHWCVLESGRLLRVPRSDDLRLRIERDRRPELGVQQLSVPRRVRRVLCADWCLSGGPSGSDVPLSRRRPELRVLEYTVGNALGVQRHADARLPRGAAGQLRLLGVSAGRSLLVLHLQHDRERPALDLSRRVTQLSLAGADKHPCSRFWRSRLRSGSRSGTGSA